MNMDNFITTFIKEFICCYSVGSLFICQKASLEVICFVGIYVHFVWSIAESWELLLLYDEQKSHAINFRMDEIVPFIDQFC